MHLDNIHIAPSKMSLSRRMTSDDDCRTAQSLMMMMERLGYLMIVLHFIGADDARRYDMCDSRCC